MSKLNRRQTDFLHHYTAGAPGVRGNATRAAAAAGYSERSAHTIGHDLLRHPKVGGEVLRVEAERAREASAAAGVDLEEWSDGAATAKAFIEDLAAGRIPCPINPAEVGYLHLRFKAAVHACDRVLGRPNQPSTRRLEVVSPLDPELRQLSPEEVLSLRAQLRLYIEQHRGQGNGSRLALPPGEGADEGADGKTS